MLFLAILMLSALRVLSGSSSTTLGKKPQTIYRQEPFKRTDQPVAVKPKRIRSKGSLPNTKIASSIACAHLPYLLSKFRFQECETDAPQLAWLVFATCQWLYPSDFSRWLSSHSCASRHGRFICIVVREHLPVVPEAALLLPRASRE
jgi:hypothetical protein